MKYKKRHRLRDGILNSGVLAENAKLEHLCDEGFFERVSKTSYKKSLRRKKRICGRYRDIKSSILR